MFHSNRNHFNVKEINSDFFDISRVMNVKIRKLKSDVILMS